MKKFILVLICILAITLFVGCNGTRKETIKCSGEVITKEYTDLVGNEIILRDIYLNHNNVESGVKFYAYNKGEKKIVLTAQQEAIDSIKLQAKNNEITIKGSTSKYYDTEAIKIEVYGYRLEDIDLEFAEGEIDGLALEKEAKVSVSVKSNIKIKEMNGEELEVNASGNSLVTLSTITTSDVEINASGASEVNSVGLEASELEVNFSGMSKGILYVHGVSTEVKLSGASSLTLNGFADELKIEESGSSNLTADEYIITKCEANLSGASVAKTNVSSSIMYKLSGASYLSYIGSPKITGESVTGESKVEKID